MIAKEFYLLHQEVEKIEKQIKNELPEKRTDLEDKLRKAKAARDRMRNALEGSKNSQSNHRKI
jgi:hypothetical protein